MTMPPPSLLMEGHCYRGAWDLLLCDLARQARGGATCLPLCEGGVDEGGDLLGLEVYDLCDDFAARLLPGGEGAPIAEGFVVGLFLRLLREVLPSGELVCQMSVSCP